MEEQLKEILSEASGVPVEDITLDSRLIADLGLTSFDFADIAVRTEEEFGILVPDESMAHIQTVRDVLCIVQEANLG